jgi:hypothetical protein
VVTQVGGLLDVSVAGGFVRLQGRVQEVHSVVSCVTLVSRSTHCALGN